MPSGASGPDRIIRVGIDNDCVTRVTLPFLFVLSRGRYYVIDPTNPVNPTRAAVDNDLVELLQMLH